MFRFLTQILASRYRPTRPPSKLVAIVVPVHDRPELTADEQISLRHLRRFLDGYDKFLIAPRGLNFELPGFETRYFSRKFFGSMRAHSRMVYWPGFYKQFEEYKYILMHHLDALVFSDQLMEWCGTDVDYIGAPWFPLASGWIKEPQVGNGGLALFKVEAVLNVLQERYRTQPVKYWEDRGAGFCKFLQALLRHSKAKAPNWFSGPYTQRFDQRLRKVEVNVRNSDAFWSFEAVKYEPGFRIPDWQTGLRFAFECVPRHCFELNEHKLPFGCHAWAKHDRAFWEPYLIK